MLTAVSPASAPVDDRALLDNEIRRRTAQGWQIVSQTPESVQFKRRAGSSPIPWATGAAVCLGLALVVYALFWLGVVVCLVMAAIAALSGKDEVAYVTVADLRGQAAKIAGGAVMKIDQGSVTVCSACGGAVRPQATFCKHCKQPFSA